MLRFKCLFSLAWYVLVEYVLMYIHARSCWVQFTLRMMVFTVWTEHRSVSYILGVHCTERVQGLNTREAFR